MSDEKNCVFDTTPREIFIGDTALFCDSLKLSASAVYTEKNSLGGKLLYTAQETRSVRLAAECRLMHDNAPLDVFARLYSMLVSKKIISVSYRGAEFAGCRLTYLEQKNDGGPVSDLKIEFICPVPEITEAV